MNKFLVISTMIVLFNTFGADCDIYDPRSYRMPRSCKGQKYCLNEGDYYPKELIRSILERSTEFDLRGGNTEPSGYDNNSEESECNAVYHPNAPIYYILDNSNRTRVVVQSTQENLVFRQKYDISRCVHEGPVAFTRHLIKNRIRNRKLKCENVYVSFGFFVTSLHSINMELVYTKLPVYCKCIYEKQ